MKADLELRNEFLVAGFKKLGAEMCSLKGVANNVEYIWQADSMHWGRHAPALFPIVGKLNHNKMFFDGGEYEMGQHGFARDSVFEVESHTDTTIVFKLTSSDASLKVFPFEFDFQIIFELKGWDLLKIYKVVNPSDDQDLLFSVGGHPAYNCPVFENSKRSDYELIFSIPEIPEKYVLEGGLVGFETKPVFEQPGIIPIEDNLFDEDALVFKHIESEAIILRHKDGRAVLQVSFPNFPYLGIWSKNETAPFVCIEPWCGLADTIGHNGDFTQKEGVNRLSPSETFTRTFATTILDR